ncbi:MAG: 3'-5' exonuclease [Magnetococcus sp. DMHC-6]
MFKNIKKLVWAFDAEWIPDPIAGRLLYKLPADLPDSEVMEEMWRKGGGTAEEPRPYLKTVLCRMVSIAAVQRHMNRDGWPVLHLLSLPRDLTDPEQIQERGIVGRFLHALGERQPQLIGYNSIAADLRILVQRGIVLGLTEPKFCQRPNKPWEGVDYFAKGSDYNIDLKEVTSLGWGTGSPSLNEIATLSGIPGKMEMDGLAVAPLWLEGHLDKIVAYNEMDAITTYLLWLRIAYFGGPKSRARVAQKRDQRE